MALTQNERYIRQFRNDLNEGIFNNPITGGRTDIGETAGGALDYLVGGGLDLYGMGADLFNGSGREYDGDDALSLLNTGTSVFMPKIVGSTLNTVGKLAQKPTNALLRGLTNTYNKAAGTNRGALQFGKPKLTPQASKLQAAPKAGGKNEIVPSSGRLPAKTLNNPAGATAKGSAKPKVDPKKGGGVIGAIKRNPIKTGLATTAGVLGANAAFNTAFDDEEDPTRPVPGGRSLDEIDNMGPDGQGQGQGGSNPPLSEKDKAAMLLDKAQQLKPRGPIRSAQDVAEAALARDVFNAGASKTRDILNEDELERKRAMRIRQQENSEQNMLRDAWRNSATGRKSGTKWDDLSDEDKAMYTDRYTQSKGYFPNSESRLASQREEDYKQGGADGTISNMDQLEEEIRRRNMQRKLEAAGGYGVGRIGGGMTLDEFETETGRKEALPPDPVVNTPDDAFDMGPEPEEEGFGSGYEKYLPYAMMALTRGKLKNLPMPKGLPNKARNLPALSNRPQKLLENRRGYPNGGLPQKSATGEQFRRAQTGMDPSGRAIGSNANISNAPYKNLSTGAGPNARDQGRFRTRQDLEEEIRRRNRGIF